MGDVEAKGATMGCEQAAMPTRLKKKKNHDGGVECVELMSAVKKRSS